MRIPKRSEVPRNKTWNLTRIYASEGDFARDLEKAQKQISALGQIKSGIASSAASLKAGLDKIFAASEIIEKLMAYASLASDADTSNEHYLGLVQRCQSLSSSFQAQIAFLTPLIMRLPQDRLKSLTTDPQLKRYQHLLSSIVRRRGHILSPAEEKISARAEDAMSASETTYGILTNSDLEYPYIQDQDENTTQLTESSFDLLIQSTDRQTRREAFDSLYRTYSHYQRTFASLLAGSVKAHNFAALIHNYPDARTASLDRSAIPVSVYDTLIQEVRKHLDLLHRYVGLRKHVLGLDKLQMWDIYVPLVKVPQISYSLDEAKQETRNALKIMGPDYMKHVDYIYGNRVIDAVPNQHKSSGAYSGGSYDTDPYELLNWEGNLDSVYTLIHETGHSVHSMYSRENQPYVYGDYPIFLAEIASTTNENILTDYFLKNITDPRARAFILNYYLDSFKGTVFRQAQFAEFEQFIHETQQKGQALTAQMLNKHYLQLNEDYYGPDMAKGGAIAKEWIRVPHFYYDFYVYQYATGFCAASSLAQRLTQKRPGQLKKYLAFLKAGSSNYPLSIMKKAGIDMTKPDYLEDAFKLFAQRLEELERLLEK